MSSAAQASFLDIDSKPEFLCRTSQAKRPEEWQADFYSSCVLMPRSMIFAAWDELFPDRKQRVLAPKSPIPHSLVEIPRLRPLQEGTGTSEEDRALERFCRPLAERFTVSASAMRIRLEKLRLLHRTVPGQRLMEQLEALARGGAA